MEAADLSITDIGDTVTLDPSVLAGTVDALYVKMEAANNHKENDNCKCKHGGMGFWAYNNS